MKGMISAVRTVAYSAGKGLLEGAKRKLQAQRAAMVPEVALVNNFDVDQRTFLTDTMKGFTMVQKGAGAGTYGTLTVQADYGERVPGQDQLVRPVPGQPALIYPVAARSGSFNTSFIRSGGTESKRYYPVNYLVDDHSDFNFVVLDA